MRSWKLQTLGLLVCLCKNKKKNFWSALLAQGEHQCQISSAWALVVRLGASVPRLKTLFEDLGKDNKTELKKLGFTS